jgi:hypothetical protein
MPIRLSRPATALAVLLVALLAAAAALVEARTATAQPATVTIVESNIAITPSNGHFDFGPGTGANDGIVGVACTGAFPRGGGNIPGQVVTQLTATSTLLRVLQQNGSPVSVGVVVNCAYEAAGAAATRNRLAKAAGD